MKEFDKNFPWVKQKEEEYKKQSDDDVSSVGNF